ncbi:MAG TPA: hypothetical protein PKY31_12380 [Spirochaetota bacterium]|nr:hypothetical protein [Spirochaetota bacterium]
MYENMGEGVSRNDMERFLVDSDRGTTYKTLRTFERHGIVHSLDLVNRGAVFASQSLHSTAFFREDDDDRALAGGVSWKMGAAGFLVGSAGLALCRAAQVMIVRSGVLHHDGVPGALCRGVSRSAVRR